MLKLVERRFLPKGVATAAFSADSLEIVAGESKDKVRSNPFANYNRQAEAKQIIFCVPGASSLTRKSRSSPVLPFQEFCNAWILLFSPLFERLSGSLAVVGCIIFEIISVFRSGLR